MKCGNCGLMNVQTARFCVRCGVPIAAAAVQTAVPYQPAPPHEEVTQPYALPAYMPHPQQMMATQRGVQHQVQVERQAGGNPAVAAILSVVIPGLGQLYNGDTKKGLLMFGGAFFGLFLLGLGWLAMMIWSGIDAFQVASGTGRRWH